MITFKDVVILNCDGRRDRAGVATLDNITFPDVVPVRKNFDPSAKMGRARLRMEGTKLVGDLEIDEGKWNPVGLFPAAGGKPTFNDTTLFARPNREMSQIVVKAEIEAVALCDAANHDSRIKALK